MPPHVQRRGKRLKLLVVAAWEPELIRFRERSGISGAAARAWKEEEDELMIAADTLGVGLVEAAIAMTQCIARHRPGAVVLLGTCGAFAPSSLPNGSVVAAARARVVDVAVLDGLAALPGPMPPEVAFDPALHDALVEAGAKSVQIANTVGITTNDGLAKRLASSSCDVEHLEAFAVARACAVAGVPCGAALGIANVVGERGRAEWLANHERASALAADVAWSAIEAVAKTIRRSTTAP
jgi:nucleoside phosphorylase